MDRKKERIKKWNLHQWLHWATTEHLPLDGALGWTHTNCNYESNLWFWFGVCGLDLSYLQHFKMFPFKTFYFFQSSTSHMTQFRVNNKSTEVYNQAFNIEDYFLQCWTGEKGFIFPLPTFPLPDRLIARLRIFDEGANLLVFILTAVFCWYFHLCLCDHVRTHGSMKEVWSRPTGWDKPFWTD